MEKRVSLEMFLDTHKKQYTCVFNWFWFFENILIQSSTRIILEILILICLDIQVEKFMDGVALSCSTKSFDICIKIIYEEWIGMKNYIKHVLKTKGRQTVWRYVHFNVRNAPPCCYRCR